MNKTFKILEEISKVPGSKKKMELLTELKDNTFAKFYFDTVFNPYLTYGVGSWNGLDGKYPVKDVFGLMELRNKLVERQLTGNDARDEVMKTFHTEDELYNKWIKLMWERNLRIGISSITINKVFDNLIPRFELQTCKSIGKDQKLDNGWIVEPKYDGLRAVLIFKDGKCKGALSRSGKELFNMEYIIDELLYKGVDNVVLDGEIYGKDWHETVSVVKASKSFRSKELIRFFVFDYIPIDEWENQKGKMYLITRKELLRLSLGFGLAYTTVVIPYGIVTPYMVWEYAQEFKDSGYEGAVAKKLDSVYEFKRSDNWLKVKFEETYDLMIRGFQEGGGRHRGRLGAIVCETGKGELVNVGGGFSDALRDEIWKHRNDYIGKIIEVKCQEKTKDGSLRFPVVVTDKEGRMRIRDDKERR